MKQIITRVNDQLAEALKLRAGEAGESVNAYINRLLSMAVAGAGSPRQLWKAAAIADGRLATRGVPKAISVGRTFDAGPSVTTEAGYAAESVSSERDAG